jgi:hypothetical protein
MKQKLLRNQLISLESSQQGDVLAGHITNFKRIKQKLLRNQLISLESPQQGGVLAGHVTIFKPMKQKLLRNQLRTMSMRGAKQKQQQAFQFLKCGLQMH